MARGNGANAGNSVRAGEQVVSHEMFSPSDGKLLDLLPAAVYFCDPSGVLVRWNERAVELWGRVPRAGDLAERFCGSYKLYRADGTFMAHADCPVADVLRTGEPQRNVEAIVERPDGSRQHIVANIDPIRNAAGMVVGAVNVLQNITDRKRAEEKLRQSEQRFRRLLDSLPAAGYTCDAEGLITYYNERGAQFWGKEPKLNDPADRYCGSFRLFSPDGTPIEHENCWMALALRNDREYHGCEIVVERPDGSRRTALAHANPFHDEDGRLAGAVNILVDITDRKRDEQSLAERNRLTALRADVSSALASVQPVEAVLQHCCDALVRHLNAAVARVWMLESEEDVLTLHASAGQHTETDESDRRIQVGQSEVGRIARDRKPYLTGDFMVSGCEWARRQNLAGFAGYPLLVEDRLVGVVAAVARDPLSQAAASELAMLADGIALYIEGKRAEEKLREQTRVTETLHRIGSLLAAELDLEKLVQAVTDEATKLAEAEFGAFFYNVQDEQGDCYLLYTLSGAPREAFAGFPMPRNTGIFAPTFRGEAPVRLDDVTQDPRYGKNAPYHGMPQGHLPVKSYLAVPVVSRSGDVLGGLFFGHSQVGAFKTRHENLALGVAAQAAIAIDNAQLFRKAREQAEQLEQRAIRLRLLWEAATVLLAAEDSGAMMWGLFDKVRQHLGVDTYFNYMVNESGDALRLVSWVGIPEETARAMQRLEFGQEISGNVALHRQPMMATHIQQSADPQVQMIKSLGIRAYACNPLVAENRLIGTLSFASRERDEFSADEAAFLETLSHYVTMACERLRLVEQLREADRRKDEFLATLAHELRNPLAPIRNGLEVLKLADGERELVNEVRGMMEQQLSQMVRLIDDLLDVARITRGKLELRKERVELSAVVMNAVEATRPLIEQMGHELSLALPTLPVYLDADPVRITQVVLNLLNNAAKYTDRGGHIWLTADRQEGDAVVTVKDNGVGIPAEKLLHIFEMFTQVEGAQERSQGGLGLGLTLVKRLTEMHGGSVEARSAGPGEGSEFTIRLPVAVAPSPESFSASSEQALAPPSRRILVVDDNRDGAESLALMLRLLGNKVHTAYDGIQALQAAEGFRPDVMLLDIGLPKLNGCEACRRIRQEPWGKGIVMIAVTGWGQDEDRRRSLEAGFNFHMVKPVNPADLEKLLRGLLLTPS